MQGEGNNMQIVMMASGTRGDVQPMLALGKALKENGHQVRLVAGSNFVDWIESHGLEAYPTIDIEAVMQSEVGLKWIESKTQFEQFRHIKTLMDGMDDVTVRDVTQGTAGADLILSGFLSEPHIQALQEQRGVRMVSVALQPYRPSRSGAASILPVFPRSASLLNYGMGLFTEYMTWRVTQKGTNLLRQRLALPPHTAGSYRRAARNIPALYAFSPLVVPPTMDTNSHTTGFWFLDEPFTPSEALEKFLTPEDAPIYVGFGSMASSDPAGIVRMVAEALHQVGRRGVLARGWSGAQVLDVPDHLFVLDKAPHTWLFPRMAAVVHHGGAGTTAAGLHAGKPALIVPHMADQPFWARRVHELGVSAKPLPRQQLTTATLTERLQRLLSETVIHTRAATLGEKIRAEQGVANAVDWLEAFVQR
jgi:sterol 3beta-glucosyltransferase